uniref:hypothetical protein n=1 Tax=Eubacterium cellulosolvens TaxID=29322 RepID=UPI00048405B1|nr:hypothetical protein [[Eubacterium] cellulosolvens]
MFKYNCAILLFLLSSFFFCGCASNSEYEALERRVTTLEERLGVTSDKNMQKNEPMNDINGEQAIVSPESSYTYDIDEMTAEKVVETYQYYYNNIPKQGSSFDDYYATLKVKPVKTSDTSIFCQFYDENDKTIPERDVIKSISIGNIEAEMDRTIGYGDTGYFTVNIDLIIHDYDKAVDIYNGFFNQIDSKVITDPLSMDYNTAITLANKKDNRENHRWESTVEVIQKMNDAVSFRDEPFLSLTKMDNYYEITFSNFVISEG